MERVGEMRVITDIKTVGVAENVGEEIHEALAANGLETCTLSNTKGDEAKTLREIRGSRVEAIATRTGIHFTPAILQEVALVMGACKGPTVDAKEAARVGTAVLKSDTNTRWVTAMAMDGIRAVTSGWIPGMHSTSRGLWEKSKIGPQRRLSPAGMSMAVLGFGQIGQDVAQAAKTAGMVVRAFNHKTPLYRKRDEDLQKRAREIGVTLHTRMDDFLAEPADVLTVHVRGKDYAERSNQGLVTEEMLRTLHPEIALNLARREVYPDNQTLQKLLEEGVIQWLLTDVFDKRLESSKTFEFPFPGHIQVAATPHSGGSGHGLANETALHVASRLTDWIKTGNIRRDSILHPYEEMHTEEMMRPGQLFVEIVRATATGIKSKLGAIREKLNWGISDEDHPNDYVPGTEIKRETVPHVMALEINGTDYLSACREFVAGLDELNKSSDSPQVISVLFRATDERQREILSKRPKLGPNLETI